MFTQKPPIPVNSPGSAADPSSIDEPIAKTPADLVKTRRGRAARTPTAKKAPNSSHSSAPSPPKADSSAAKGSREEKYPVKEKKEKKSKRSTQADLAKGKAIPQDATIVDDERKVEAPVKKRKRKRKDDGAWGKSSDKVKGKPSARDGGGGMLVAFRHVKPKKLDEDTLLPKPEEKTSFVVNRDLAESLTPQRRTLFAARLQHNAKVNPFYTPPGRCTLRSERGTPLQYESLHSKTILDARICMGSIRFFKARSSTADTDRPHVLHPELKWDGSKAGEVQETKVFQAVKPAGIESEGFEWIITPESAQKAAKQIKEDKGIRSQNPVMARQPKDTPLASANVYGKIFNDQLVYEWLHYMMHNMAARKAQVATNLGCGSFDANSIQLGLELNYAHLIRRLPEGFTLKTLPNYHPGVEGSRLLTEIRCTLILSDCPPVPFSINGQAATIPDFTDHIFLRMMLDSLIGLNSPTEEDGVVLSRYTDGTGELFFTPPRHGPDVPSTPYALDEDKDEEDEDNKIISEKGIALASPTAGSGKLKPKNLFSSESEADKADDVEASSDTASVRINKPK